MMDGYRFVEKSSKGLSYWVGPQDDVPGRVLIVREPKWDQHFFKIFQLENCQHIRLPSNWASGFEFLNSFNEFEVQGVEVQSPFVKDILPLEKFSNLSLFLSDAKCDHAPDFSRFENLEVLGFEHRRAMESAYLIKRPKIRRISGFPDARLERLVTSQNLTDLRIERGKLNSLDDIARFENLESVTLVRLRNLTSIAALAECPSIKNLFISGCPNIKDFDACKHLVKFKE